MSADGVFSSQNIIEAELETAVLRMSRRRFLVADHTKYGTFGFSVFARPEEFDALISDSRLPEVDRLRELGIEVIIAE